MRFLRISIPLLAVMVSLALFGCQAPLPQRGGASAPRLTNIQGAQQTVIRANPETVRQALVESAQSRGTRVVQSEPYMVVLERRMGIDDPALDAEFGPSNNGPRLLRVRVRLQGDVCNTLAVQDLALVNNAHTALERAYRLPGDVQTQASLDRLRRDAEARGVCL